MATVIDRLRVQGGSFPECHFDRSRPTRRSDRKNTSRQAAAHNFNGEASRLQYPSTPIAKRMDFFSKIRQANIGLSSMDSPNIQPGEDTAHKVNFFLNGKGVNSLNGSTRKSWTAVPKAGSYKTTPRDLYRVSHGICLKRGIENSPFGNGIQAVADYDGSSHNSQRLVKSSTNPRYFMNGAHSTAPSTVLPPSSTAPSSTLKTSNALRAGALTSLELTGQNYAGYSSNFDVYDSAILEDSCFPYLRSPRKRTRMPRYGFQSDPFSDISRSQELQDCLKIKKSALPSTRKSVSQPCPPRIEGDTKLIRTSGKENVNKDLRRYDFSNVNSYHTFNRYHPQSSPNLKPKMAHIPRGIVSLPAPWAESVLLKLVGDLQNPKLRLSSAKYSDIGVHGDLDEYFVVGSPSSLEKHGRILGNQRSQIKGDLSSKSLVGAKAADRIDEVDEEILEVEGTAARAQTARSEISSVDIKDIENRKLQLDARLEDKAASIKDDMSREPRTRQSSASAPGNINEESRLDSDETIEQKQILKVVVKKESKNNLIQDLTEVNGESATAKQ